MRTTFRWIILMAPLVFLLGLWLGLNKPGWSPRSWKGQTSTIKVLCPPGVFSKEVLDYLRVQESLDLRVTQMDSIEVYFRLLYQNLKDFDVVCLMSHHVSPAMLEDRFSPLPVSGEWVHRRVHADFQSIPVDPTLQRFFPLGWRVYLPMIPKSSLNTWSNKHLKDFHLYLEPDFRELLHIYLGKDLLREDWFHPEHTDPLTSSLEQTPPYRSSVTKEELLKLAQNPPTDSMPVLYFPHTLWASLPPEVQNQWTWGLDDLKGNLQVLGLAQPKDSPNSASFEHLLRSLSRSPVHEMLSWHAGWASPMSGFTGPSVYSPEQLRTIPLTHYSVETGLDPSAIFWERIVNSAKVSQENVKEEGREEE